MVLGLQNGDDSFSGFLSASTEEKKEEKPATTVDTTKNEEESFFNQTVPTEKEKVKLTKDSILALYGSMPSTNNFNQFQAPTQVINYFSSRVYKHDLMIFCLGAVSDKFPSTNQYACTTRKLSSVWRFSTASRSVVSCTKRHATVSRECRDGSVAPDADCYSTCQSSAPGNK